MLLLKLPIRMISSMLPIRTLSLPLHHVHGALFPITRNFSSSTLIPASSTKFPLFSSGAYTSHQSIVGSGSAPLLQRGLFSGLFASLRGFRKARGRPAVKKQLSKEKRLELDVKICLEEELPEDPEILSIAEMLRLNVPMAMKIAFDGLKDSLYETRDATISDVGRYEKVELSILLCNDQFIQKLNKDWRDVDHATDVLSASQHIHDLGIPVLMLGDIAISVETAARQAEEGGHTLLDEIRILLVHGLLHLLGFDHEISDKAEAEMEKEEELILHSLGWKGKGLIHNAYETMNKEISNVDEQNNEKTERILRFYRPKFNYIFCDIDGTLLNSNNEISPKTAAALREAMSRGIRVIVATGKTRPAVIRALKLVNLAGKDGVASESSPGIFLQGLLVYGIQGREIFRRNLDPDVCREAFLYSLERRVPLVAFSQGRCLTLYDHPQLINLNVTYYEPKAEVIPSIEELLASADIQKLLFYDTVGGVANTLRPYWELASKGRAGVVQAQPDMLEIVPLGSSKGHGVKVILDHFGATASEIMAIGDGENDVEMLQLASVGVALENGSEKAKSVANAICASNDEDGVADAIYRFAF